MKCSKCCGDGWNLRITKKGDGYATEKITCEYCHGTGKFPDKTNFDRITASPEALAEFIDGLVSYAYDLKSTSTEDDYFKYCFESKERVLNWLKQESE